MRLMLLQTSQSIPNASRITASYSPLFAKITSTVITGDYKPLTWWDSISLGASYFVNPQRATTAEVAYSFDSPEFSDKADELWKLATEEKISFGVSKREGAKVDSIAVGPLSELQKLFPVHNAADLSTVLAKDNVYVIFNSQMLLGEASAMPVIKSTSGPTRNK